ncbi:MAG TPA: hypothetical protein VIC87_05900, partial [Vicinamibacteria bacterium]
MRAALLAGLLAACSGPPLLEVVRSGRLPAGVTDIALGETPLYRGSYLHPVRLRSRAKTAVRLTARLEEPVPRGVAVDLTGETTLLPEGTGDVVIVLTMPKELGPFEGRVALLSEDVPDWKHVHTFHGVVVDKPFEGKYLRAEPPRVDLGEVRAGERVAFAFALRGVGTEPVVVREWSPHDSARVRVRRPSGAVTIEPGKEHRIEGEVQVPAQAGPFQERIRVLSDAKNVPALDVAVLGSVVRDHEVTPHRLDWGNVYRREQPECSIRVRARAGVPPFRVASVDGVLAHFDVVSMGGAEPAEEQTVRLRVKANAPVGPLTDYAVRLHLEPGGEVLEWAVTLNVLPSIHAQPEQVDFGDVREGAEPSVEVRLVSSGNRSFEVTGVQCDNARFVVEERRAAPLPWTIRVSVA